MASTTFHPLFDSLRFFFCPSPRNSFYPPLGVSFSQNEALYRTFRLVVGHSSCKMMVIAAVVLVLLSVSNSVFACEYHHLTVGGELLC